MQQHGPALEFASEKMRGTKSVVRAAVAQDQDDAATAAVATYVADAMDVVLRG